jgi:hypothetical protein
MKYIVAISYIDAFGQLQNQSPEVFNSEQEALDFLKKEYAENESYLCEEMDSELDEECGTMTLYFQDDTVSQYDLYVKEV